MTSMDMNTTVELVRVTPGIARMWLEGNTHNRSKRDRRIQMYARDMIAGNWKVTGDTIKFNGDGTLLDGQHRLEACVLSGIPFETYVITGLKTDAQIVMDSGLARRVSDQLVLMGMKHSKTIPAIARIVMRYDRNQVAGVGSDSRAINPTHSEVIDFIEADSNRIQRAADFGGEMRSKFRARQTYVGAAHFISGHTHTGEFESFMTQVANGVALDEGSPQIALRRWIDRNRHRGTETAELAVIIKTFNSYIAGRSVTLAKFSPSVETFPRMIVGDRAHLES